MKNRDFSYKSYVHKFSEQMVFDFFLSLTFSVKF